MYYTMCTCIALGDSLRSFLDCLSHLLPVVLYPFFLVYRSVYHSLTVLLTRAPVAPVFLNGDALTGLQSDHMQAKAWSDRGHCILLVVRSVVGAHDLSRVQLDRCGIERERDEGVGSARLDISRVGGRSIPLCLRSQQNTLRGAVSRGSSETHSHSAMFGVGPHASSGLKCFSVW